MQNEVHSISMLSIVLIALGVVISLSFTALVIVKKTANEGVEGTTSSLNIMKSADYDTYVNTEITGYTLKQLVDKSIENKYAILVEVPNESVPLSADEYIAQVAIDSVPFHFINYGVLLSTLDNIQPLKVLQDEWVSWSNIKLTMLNNKIDTKVFLNSENTFVINDSKTYKDKSLYESIVDTEIYYSTYLYSRDGEKLGLIVFIKK